MGAQQSLADKELLRAVANNEYDAAVAIILRGANVNCANEKTQDTPLHLAAAVGNTRIAEMLISKGAIHQKNAHGETPLHASCKRGASNCAAYLLSRGADVLAMTNDRKTPLHLAASTGQEQFIRYLLKHGARADLRDAAGNPPLTYARGAAKEVLQEAMSIALHSKPLPAAVSAASPSEEDAEANVPGATDRMELPSSERLVQQIKRLEAEVVESEHVIGELTAERKAAEARADQSERQRCAAEERMRVAEGKAVKAWAKAKEMEEKFEEMQQRVRELEEQNKQLQEELDNKNDEVRALEDMMSSMPTEAAAREGMEDVALEKDEDDTGLAVRMVSTTYYSFDNEEEL